MANPLFARLQATAQRLIAKFGQASTITRITPPDPVLGGDPVETVYAATLVAMAYSAREIDGTEIQSGDIQIYISSVGLVIGPKPGDLVAASGKTFRVIKADPNNYDGLTNVVFIVQGRIAD
ncbi:hypothetical protein [Sinorhizobium fredii]|uniref:Uncharacterized protein n=1 Tax=Rhizobium fredii TaxID=380 RepID=A0A2L0H4J7_RHIFR|nr:hypothetical protein [Sinorhizobium fredii]AUX76405.1 hypothetical protein NXT3_CH01837 [Sinorhizobium fredii]